MNKARQATIPLITALLLGTSWMMSAAPARAEMFPAAVVATFKSGMVTAVRTTSIQISGAEYRVKSGAELVDHKGYKVKLAEVFLESEAKFHLNKDGEIDKMVVTRPQ